MTTDKQPQTFEEWQASAFAGGLGGGYSIAEMAWHARDDEVADLKRQLAYGESRFADTLIWITREHEIELAELRGKWEEK